MAIATFDTLKFANDLKSAGVPPQQAEAKLFAELLAVDFKELSTKDDLKQAVGGVNAKTGSVEQRLNATIDNVEQRLNAKIDKLEQRLNATIDSFSAKIVGEMALLKWMVGLSITLNVAVLLRLFLGRPI